MTNAQLDTFTDDSQTCTVDEAAAKLLGWMRNPIRLKTVQFSRKGYRAEDLPHLPGLSTPLLETLQSFRDWAEDDLIRAIDDGTDLTTIDEACTRLDRWEEQHKHAVSFLAAIRRELAKVKDPALQIDEAATAADGETQITLDSLDRWALHTYGVSVRADSVAPAVPREYRPEKEIPADKGMSRTKAAGLQISFALLVEEYARSIDGYHTKKEKKPIVSVIAGQIAALAKNANHGAPLQGQDAETIKDRIEKALHLKNEGY